MLQSLTKPIIIGNVSFPFFLLIIFIVCFSIIGLITYFYVKEYEKSVPSHKKIKSEDIEEEDFKKDLKKLKRSLPYLNKKDANEKFIQILRSFFKNLLKLDYEFTLEELANELKKQEKPKEMIVFCNNISNYKYNKGSVTKKQLLIFIKKLEAIIAYENISEFKKVGKKEYSFEKLRNTLVSHIRKPPVKNK